MTARIDMTGQTYNSLTVLYQAKTTKKQAYWVCRCVCGNIVTADGFAIRSGRKKTCGCKRKPEKGKNTLQDVAKAAKMAGMTYGKYVEKMGHESEEDKQWNELTESVP